MKKKFFKITAFLLAVAITFACAVQILDFKYLDSTFKVDSFYELEDNTVDVLVIGSSHAYQGINTAVLWKEYGYTAFNFCGAAQQIWNTYYYLEEALKTQTPKVILFDTYYIHASDEYGDTSFAIKNTYGLKWSDTKKAAIEASFDKEIAGNQYFYSILQYHTRYSDLSKTDFYPYQANREMYENHKGFYCYFRNEKVTERDLTEVDYFNEMTEKVDYYYRKIFELAKEKNIPIIPMAIPFNAENYHQGFFRLAEFISEYEYNTPFLNFLTEYKSALGLDYTTDFSDAQHLNYKGNTKLTRFIGDYIKTRYNIPDRRGDEKYESWEKDAEVYYNQLENHEATLIDSLPEYEDVIKNERYKVVITSSFRTFDDIKPLALKKLEKFCKAVGIPASEYKNGGMWIFEGGEKIFYDDCSEDNFRKIVSFDRYNAIEIRKNEKIYDHDTGKTFLVNCIMSNKKDITKANNGFNIYVYDTFTKSQIDVLALTYNSGEIRR